MEVTLEGLTDLEWADLARRVATGLAVDRDADRVEAIGLLPQAIAIRSGMATHKDAVLINIQAGLRLLDIEPASQQGAA